MNIHEMEPQNILLLGDTHGDLSSATGAVQMAQEKGCQVILQLGDFGFMGQGVDKFTHKLNRALAKAGIVLYWVDGNHENHDRIERLSPGPDGTHQIETHIYHLPRGFRWEWGGVRFLALGGAYSIDKASRKEHVSWWPQERITEADIIRCGDAPTDVLVCHDVPWGVDDPYGSYRENKNLFPESNRNRQALRAVVEATQPRLVVHGHTHWRKSSWLRLEGCRHDVQIEGFGSNPYWAGGGLGSDQWDYLALSAMQKVLNITNEKGDAECQES